MTETRGANGRLYETLREEAGYSLVRERESDPAKVWYHVIRHSEFEWLLDTDNRAQAEAFWDGLMVGIAEGRSGKR